MVRQIKEDRVIKLFFGKIYKGDTYTPHMEFYYVDKRIDVDILYNQLRIANINKDNKNIFLFSDSFPFYNKIMHSNVLEYFSEYKGFVIDVFSIRYGTINIDELL